MSPARGNESGVPRSLNAQELLPAQFSDMLSASRRLCCALNPQHLCATATKLVRFDTQCSQVGKTIVTGSGRSRTGMLLAQQPRTCACPQHKSLQELQYNCFLLPLLHRTATTLACCTQPVKLQINPQDLTAHDTRPEQIMTWQCIMPARGNSQVHVEHAHHGTYRFQLWRGQGRGLHP